VKRAGSGRLLKGQEARQKVMGRVGEAWGCGVVLGGKIKVTSRYGKGGGRGKGGSQVYKHEEKRKKFALPAFEEKKESREKEQKWD